MTDRGRPGSSTKWDILIIDGNWALYSHWMRVPSWMVAALLGVCLYSISLRGTYIYDDEFFVRDDPRLHSISQWPKFWTQAYFPTSQDRLYRPLTSMTYAVQWQLFGNSPWIFHLINILLYGATCAGIAELAKRVGGVPLGYAAGLLFAAHPVHVEAVSYLVGRAELLSTGAIVWAMILSLGKLSPRRIISIALLFIIGLLSKEQAMLLPIFIGGLFLICDPKCAAQNPRRKILFLVLCWTDAAYLVAREYSKMKFSFDPGLLDWTAQPLIRAVGADRWLIPFSVLGRYVTLLIAPYHQSIDYGYAIIGYVQQRGDPFLWIGLAIAVGGLIALIIAIVVFLKHLSPLPVLRERARVRAFPKLKEPSFSEEPSPRPSPGVPGEGEIHPSGLLVWCLLGLGLSYGLVSNFAGIIGTIMGERLLFLPSVFFIILLAWILLKIPRPVAMSILTLAVVLGSIRTVFYANQWNDRLAFYQRQAIQNPRSERIWWLLAGDLAHRGRYAEAQLAAAHMQAIDPDYWVGWYEAANISMDAGQYKQALQYLDRAWRCTMTDHLAVNLLRTKIHDRQNRPGSI